VPFCRYDARARQWGDDTIAHCPSCEVPLNTTNLRPRCTCSTCGNR